jgi:hypothetical protein
MALIAVIGRGKKDPLVNQTAGGDGGFARTWTPEHHAKMKAYWESAEGLARKERARISAREIGLRPENIERLAHFVRTEKPCVGRPMSQKNKIALSIAVKRSNSTRGTTKKTRALRSARSIRLWQDRRTRDKILQTRARNVEQIRTTARESAKNRSRDDSGRFL